MPASRDPQPPGNLADLFERLNCGELHHARQWLEEHPDVAKEIPARWLGLPAANPAPAPPPTATADVASPHRTVPGPAGIGPEASFAADGKLLGDYQLIREIGRGGMGVVHEALQLSLQRRVALKALVFAGALNPRHLARFQNESQAAARLQHKHIVPVYFAGQDRGVHFYVMQLIEGGTLADLIENLKEQAKSRSLHDTKRGRSTIYDHDPSVAEGDARAPAAQGRPKTPASAFSISGEVGSASKLAGLRQPGTSAYFRSLARLALQAAEALEYAHQRGVVHRDIKPSNLLLDHQGDLWVADFGLAQLRGQPNMTATGHAVGTLRYMSPEQACDRREIVDQRADVYSLGVTLYELLTLQPVYRARDFGDLMHAMSLEKFPAPRRVRPEIPEDLETIVLKAMAKDAGDRYADAGRLAEDLLCFLDDRPIQARPPSPWQKLCKWSRRNAEKLSAGCFAALLVGIIAGGFIWSYHQHLLTALGETRRRNQQLNIAQRDLGREQQRTVSALRSAEALLRLADDPGQAVKLAQEAFASHPSPETRGVLLKTQDASRQLLSLQVPAARLGSVLLSPSGAVLLATRHETQAQDPAPAWLWDVTQPQQPPLLLRGKTPITGAAFGPTGNRVLTTSSVVTRNPNGDSGDPGVSVAPAILWDTVERRALSQLPEARVRSPHAAMFSPDNLLVMPVGDQRAVVVDAMNGRQLHLLTGHSDTVTFAAFSPRGRFIVTLGQDRAALVWDRQGRLLHTLTGPWEDRPPKFAVFSPDEQMLATVDCQAVQLWDVESGERHDTTHRAGGLCAFSSDGQRLYTAQRFETSIQVYGGTDWGQVASWPMPSPVTDLTLDPRGRWLLLPSQGRIRLVDLTDGKAKAEFKGHSQPIDGVGFSADGGVVVSFDRSGEVRLWRMHSGEELASAPVQPAELQATLTWQHQHNGFAVSAQSRLRSFVVSTDVNEPLRQAEGLIETAADPGRPVDDVSVVLVRQTHALQLWDWKQNVTLHRAAIHSQSQAELLRLGPGAASVLVVGGGAARLWTPGAATPWRTLADVGDVRIADASFSPTGQELALADAAGMVTLWDVASGQRRVSWQLDTPLCGVRLGPDGRLAAISENAVWLLLPDQPDARQVIRSIAINQARFSAEGRFLVTFHDFANVAVQVWDTQTAQLLHALESVTGQCEVAISPTAPAILVASPTGGLIWWNYVTGETKNLGELGVSTAAFSPTGERVVSASRTEKIDPRYLDTPAPPQYQEPVLTTWDVATGQRLHQQSSAVGDIIQLQWLSSDHVAVTARSFGAAVLEIVRDSLPTDLRSQIEGHAARISDLAFDPQDELLATASWDHTAGVWDAVSGSLKFRLVGHEGPLTGVAFNPSAKQLATASSDQTVRLWSSEDGRPLSLLDAHRDIVLGLSYCVQDQHTRLVTYGRDGRICWWEGDKLIASHDSPYGSYVSVDVAPNGAVLAAPAPPVRHSKQTLDRGAALFRMEFERLPEGGKPLVEYYPGPNQQPITIHLDAQPLAVQLDRSGGRALVLDQEGKVRAWTLGANTEKPDLLIQSTSAPIRAASFSRDGKRVLTDDGSRLNLWDAANNELIVAYPHAQAVSRHNTLVASILPFSPDGQWIVGVTGPSDRRRLRRWPTQIGDP